MRKPQRDSMVGFVLRELAAIEPRLNQAHDNVREWHASGYPTNSMPQVGGKGTVTDRTGNAALHPDTFAKQGRDADRLLSDMVNAVQALVAFVNLNTQPTTGIYCGNLHCDRIMTGQGNDRPRGHHRECPRCYMHRRRHAAPWPHQPVLPAVQNDVQESVTLPIQ